MTTVLRLLASIAIFTAPHAQAAKTPDAPDAKTRAKEQTTALGEYYGKLSQAKTLGELLKTVDANLHPDMKSFLAAKASGSESEALTISQEGKDTLTVRFQGMVIPLRYLGENEAGPRFEINRKTIEFDPTSPPETLWDKVTTVLPKKSAGLYDLAVPRAEALVAPVLWGVGAVVGGIAGIGGYIGCDVVSKDLAFCTEYGGIRNAYFRQKSVDHAQRFTSKVCSDVEALLKCLDGSPGDHGGARKSPKKSGGAVN